jgi:putative tricarboxylic transport membrane protein
VASLATAFGLFIVGMESLGFDVAAWLFMIVGLYISGEKRWWVLVLFPAVFAVLVVYGYDLLIPYSFPTMFL